MSPQPFPRVREYDVDLNLDFATGEFRGTVGVVLAERVRQCRLNALELEVRPVDPAVRLEARPADEEIVVDLPAESDTFSLAFSGKVADRGLLGLYWSRFGTGRIVASQSAATGCRRIFPCLDRPDRRALVRLTLTVADGLEVIFNTPVARERVDGDLRTFEFEPTPSMATYLVFLAVGKFDWLPVEGRLGRVRVAAPPGRGAAGAFALAHGAEILAAFETYYGIPYPLPKLDLVAVPEFAYGAMENWGAISFRDMRLLVEADTSARQKRETLTTIAHEIAHQWFGNLVTMEWWTDIWLNESFATFMEEKIIERLHPTLGISDDFLLDWGSYARLGDSLETTHPIHVPVDHPDEISEIFDEISYGKGASVLRMIEALLDEESFRSGVVAYLQKYAYGNATSADLWSSLETASGKPVTRILSQWVQRPGIPLLEAAAEGDAIHVRQRRFRLNGHHGDETWPIPLGVYRDGAVERTVVEAAETVVPTNGASAVNLNPGGLGFYRVRYDGPLLDRVRSAFPTFPPIDRWAILTDLYAFVLSGDISLSDYFRFVDVARDTDDYLVVHELANQLASVRQTRIAPLGALLADTPEFRRSGLGFFRAQLDRLGPAAVDGEPDTDGILRERVLLGLLAYDDTLAKQLAGHFDEYDRLDPNLREPVAYAYGRVNGAAGQAALFERIAKATSEGDLMKLERGLSAATDPALLRTALAAIGTPKINRAHVSVLVYQVALNPHGRDAAWEWLTTRLLDQATSLRGTGLISDMLEHATPFAALGRGEAAARAAFADHPVPEGERGIRKGIEWLRVFEAVRARVAPDSPARRTA
ncbi:MAG TPA: M1 family metallopeptidase [Thermoplasmata archaeon]|nr:M1 family metallopeptidase [Thermoplasmata archaeon]